MAIRAIPIPHKATSRLRLLIQQDLGDDVSASHDMDDTALHVALRFGHVAMLQLVRGHDTINTLRSLHPMWCITVTSDLAPRQY
jgi:hypothetical protein